MLDPVERRHGAGAVTTGHLPAPHTWDLDVREADRRGAAGCCAKVETLLLAAISGRLRVAIEGGGCVVQILRQFEPILSLAAPTEAFMREA